MTRPFGSMNIVEVEPGTEIQTPGGTVVVTDTVAAYDGRHTMFATHKIIENLRQKIPSLNEDSQHAKRRRT